MSLYKAMVLRAGEGIGRWDSAGAMGFAPDRLGSLGGCLRRAAAERAAAVAGPMWCLRWVVGEVVVRALADAEAGVLVDEGEGRWGCCGPGGGAGWVGECSSSLRSGVAGAGAVGDVARGRHARVSGVTWAYSHHSVRAVGASGGVSLSLGSINLT